MRRDAKASTAGSTQRQAGRLGRFFRGADATRGGAPRAKGSSAPSAARLLVAIFTLALLCSLIPASASAVTTRLPLSFSPITGSGIGASFVLPSGVAVDESNGNVFLADTGNGTVFILGADGGVPTGVAAPYKIEGFSFGGEPTALAVDNSAASPNKGMLYVVDVQANVIKKYTRNPSTQVYEAAGQLIATEPAFFEPLGVAIDSSGNVFVADYLSGSVVKFNPAGAQIKRIDITGAFGNTSSDAVDSDGDLFVEGYGGGVYEFPANGSGEIEPSVFTQLEAPGPPAGEGEGVAVDSAANQVLVSYNDRVVQYDATTLAKQFEFGLGQFGLPQRLVANSTSGRVYIADKGSANIAVYGPSVVVPGVEADATTNIAATSATLNATVNPDGLAVTDCKFEYGTTTAYGSSKPCEGAIPTDSSDHPVTGALTGLTPGTTYHFRVTATNANGANRTLDQTFVTRNPAVTNPASNVKGTKATLNGSVNPEGAPVTECKFEYGTTTAYGSSTSCVGAIPTDESPHPVTADLTGLTPNSTTYHFRIVITGGSGTVAGADRIFNTANTVIANPATGVTGTKATLNGSVNPEGAPVTECKFEYGTTTAYGSSKPCEGGIPTDESPHPITASLDHLAPNGTTYHFRVSVTGGSGVIRSTDRTFVTADTVVTSPATAITATSATLNGTLNPEGIEYTECKFEYGTAPYLAPNAPVYSSSVPCAESPASIGTGSSPVTVHADISGLALGITYHFRLVGTNIDGTARGANRTFTTLGPVITEEWAESVAFAEATLKARINPGGLATTYHLEYGVDTSYGSNTPEKPVGSDETNHTMTTFIEGLEPDTTYHWRAVATNSLGTSFGPDLVFHTFERFTEDTSCPNREFRVGAAAALPDCRAYEMVSPVDKQGADISTKASSPDNVWTAINQSAEDGGKFTYSAGAAFGDAQGAARSTQYMSTRNPAGWMTHGISPPHAFRYTEFLSILFETEYKYFTPDLSAGYLMYNDKFNRLAADAAPAEVPNIYKRDLTPGGGYEALINEETGLQPHGTGAPFPEPQGISRDGSVAAFVVGGAPLTPDADPGSQLQTYVWSSGKLELVSILPNGDPSTKESQVGTGNTLSGEGAPRRASVHNAISEDGSRVFWSELDDGFEGALRGAGKLYLRQNAQDEPSLSGACDESGKACTIQISGANPAFFEQADPSGSKVLYREGGALYEFDVETETRTLIASELLVGHILGASEDLSLVYFASRENLASGAVAGEPNLYISNEGVFTFIATLAAQDFVGGGSGVSSFSELTLTRGGRVTPDGRHAAFMSKAILPTVNFPDGYDNVNVKTGSSASEVFIYEADSNELVCASCNPSRARPSISKTIDLGPAGIEYSPNSAAWITPWNMHFYGQRALSDDGERLFFNAFDALLPQDTNGKMDVYQWEAEGSGSCNEAGGCISLISNGKSPQDSEFFDASASGDDVFIKTASSLVPQDPGLVDAYDARVNGGFPQPTGTAPCEGEACQTPPAPPNDPTPASASFRGAGDPTPRKASRRCRSAQQRGSKKAKSNAKRKAAKGCRRAKGRAGR